MKVRIPNEDLRFVEVPIKSLREDVVFDMIKRGQLQKHEFAGWVEALRDEWLNFGHATCSCSDNNEHSH